MINFRVIFYGFILIFLSQNFVESQPGGFEMDNGLIGVPDIQCNSDTIEMRFKTKKKFNGKIFVQGHYGNPECKVDYGQVAKDGRPVGGIKLSHGACDMDRQRMIRPEGMQFSTVIVISFHPLFVTKIDRAFHINCLYREADQTVNQELEVSDLPPIMSQNDMPMPICTYTIRKDEIDGPILKYAKVGDQVVHRWECDSEIYGILVHSCNVEDGQGNKYKVVDEKGCHTDRKILGDPTYAEALNLAYRESYVFKFADKMGVRFQCEIRLCVKESGGCNGITPPTCDDHPSREWMSNNTSVKDTRKLSKRSNPSSTTATTTLLSKNTIDTDLISQFLYVIDDDGEVSPSINGNEQLSSEIPIFSSQHICLSNIFFIFFACVFLALFVLTIALAIFFVRKQHRTKSSTIDSTPKIRPFTMVFN